MEVVEIAAPSLDRGIALLEILDQKQQGLTLTELSREIGVPKNSTSRLVGTLMSRGYLVREEATLRIRLTGKLLKLGQPRRNDVTLSESALVALRQLRDDSGETAQLGIPIGDEGIIIEKLESTRSIRVGVDIGLRFCLHNCAPGKVFLAFQPPEERRQTLDRIRLERFTERTIVDRAALEKECERVVKQGYGTDWGEADEGIHCVAAPIHDPAGKLVATIWVSGISGRMPRGKFSEIGLRVKSAASEIERRLRG